MQQPPSYFLVTNFNNWMITKEAVNSIAHYEPEAWIYVVDDHSKEVAAQFTGIGNHPNLKFIENGGAPGYLNALNWGVQSIREDCLLNRISECIVVLFDADAQLIEPIIKPVQSEVLKPIVGALAIRLVDHLGKETGATSPFPALLEVALGQKLSQWLPHSETIFSIHSCCLVTKLSVLNKVGNFDPLYYFLSGDIDWGMRLTKLGFEQKIISQVSAIHPGGASGFKNGKRVAMWVASTGLFSINHNRSSPFYFLISLMLVRLFCEAIAAAILSLKSKKYYFISISRWQLLKLLIQINPFKKENWRFLPTRIAELNWPG